MRIINGFMKDIRRRSGERVTAWQISCGLQFLPDRSHMFMHIDKLLKIFSIWCPLWKGGKYESYFT